MHSTAMADPFFPEIERVAFEGHDAQNDLAFRYYDPERIVPSSVRLTQGCTESCHENFIKDVDASTFTHSIGHALGGAGKITCASCHSPHFPLSSSRCLDCHDQSPETLSAVSLEDDALPELVTEIIQSGQARGEFSRGVDARLAAASFFAMQPMWHSRKGSVLAQAAKSWPSQTSRAHSPPQPMHSSVRPG